MSKFDLDDVIYGVPNEDQLRQMKNVDLEWFDCTLPDIPQQKPPANSSEQTRSELERLVRIQEYGLLSDEFLEQADESIIGTFQTHLSQYGLDVPLWIEDLAYQVGSLMLHLKFHYGRPRPRQIASYHGVPLIPAEFSTSHSPSYPSGHACMGFLFGQLLEKMYGEKYELRTIGAGIAYSRLQGGVHFPSDMKYGLQLADFLFEHLVI